jgi:CRP-like cAMP-binding protein
VQTRSSLPALTDLDTLAAAWPRHLRVFEVAQGHVLVRPGEPGSGLFIIEKEVF